MYLVGNGHRADRRGVWNTSNDKVMRCRLAQIVACNYAKCYYVKNKTKRDSVMIKIFDTHAHYDDEDYDLDREELLAGFPSQGVLKVTNIGTGIASSKVTAAMTEKYENMYGVIGIFPSQVQELEEVLDGGNSKGIEELRQLAKNHKKIVAIGEIGLDYHYEDTDKKLQQKWFAGQMNLARELSLPIAVHSRDAAKDTIEIMRAENASEIGGVIHCYSYTKESARDFLNMGFYFGIGGVVTFKNAKKLKEAVEYIPLENIVLETDAPYLTPEPFRGKRNVSSHLTYVAKAIADLKGITEEEVYEATWKNAHAMYKIALDS